jgi:hypothetical protein
MNEQTIRYLLDPNNEGSIEVIQSLLDVRELTASHAQKSEMLEEIKRIVATSNIEYLIQNRTVLNDIFHGRYVRRVNNNAELLDNRADPLELRSETVEIEETTRQVSFMDKIEDSFLFTEIEKQVLISREDRAYAVELTKNENTRNDRPDLLSDMSDRAKWDFYEIASAKLRLLKLFKIPLIDEED